MAGKGSRGGPKEKTFTDEQRAQVLALATYGVTFDEIAKYIGVCKKTLMKHFRKELDEAQIDKEVKVRRFLFEGATGEAMGKHGAQYADCVRAAMFWAKTQMGFKEKQDLNVSNEDGSLQNVFKIEIVRPYAHNKDS